MTDGPDLTSGGWQSIIPELSPRYAAVLDAAADRTQHHRLAAIDLLEVRAGERALDVGCGTSDVLTELSRRGARALGVDRSQGLLATADERLARAGGAALLVQGDACDLPFPDQAIDAIHCTRVLMHLDHPELAIAEMARVLARAGRAVLTEPDWSSLTVRSGDSALDEFVRVSFASGVRQPDIGRRLANLATASRLQIMSVRTTETSKVGRKELDPQGVLDGLVSAACERDEIDQATADQWRGRLRKDVDPEELRATSYTYRVSARRSPW